MSRREAKKGKKIRTKVLVILCFIVIIALAVFLGWKFMNPETKEVISDQINSAVSGLKEPEKQIKIYSGTDRPIACMIDNHSDAWPQFSINDAYIVYEIIVEGGETRLMALFKGKDLSQIGPMRSARHYFLDYALENDAIYAHIGWSPQAQSDIRSLGVNNINGIDYDTGKAYTEGAIFWRISKTANKTYKIPHNSITSTAALMQTAEQKGYRTTSDKESVLNYVADPIMLDDKADAIAATDITIPFSTLQKVNFKYNAETQNYTRYARNEVQTDATTSENITTKNIIITFARNYTMQDTENKGRQDLENTGTKDGYYITNGKAIPITCTKESRSSQTVYKDLEGNEIKVNDGNTFIEICPIDAEVVIQ